MTINRRLRERNLRARRPLRCLPLTPVHRQVRLQWCRERSTWNCADWGRIVFSDESRFLLRPDDRRKHDLKWRAVGRMEAGQSQVEVAKWLNVNKSVVSKIWKQFIETGTIKRKEGSGFTKVLFMQDDQWSVCIPLTSAHRRARLNWCLEHHAWTHDQWANVLFNDESRFSLNTDSRRVSIWREPGTRYHPSNIREIYSFRGGSLLVWAGISSSRRTPLHIFSGGTLTAQRYRDEILEPYLRPYRDQIGHNLI
ncbi:hypothetical protein LAZ67_20002317 [Cordylochernes scorpioides]|uniref:Transposase Tc1-like domain-containing protein n=1 Tax=Cordylochernes scorpioides TaxID=51811 RepID=A0ABY6LMD5_9ARAC|nr:hypothetical protein LAZ67_20002317 [Cordylochernes scorpioides]